MGILEILSLEIKMNIYGVSYMIRKDWWQDGYDNAAIRFAYIPDFPNAEAKKEWEKGYKAGMNVLSRAKALKTKVKRGTCISNGILVY